MKNTKMPLSLLLTLALVLSLFAGLTLTARAAEPSYGFDFLEDDTLSVRFDRSNDNSITSASVPTSIEGMPVSMLANSCFHDLPELSSVTIPEGIVMIGKYVFSDCPKLKTITFPASVTALDAEAFTGSSLEAISIASSSRSFTSVDGVLFSKDKKTLIAYPPGRLESRYRVPDGVTAIGPYAFYNSRLTQITLPDTLTDIGNCAFSNCVMLKELQIPDSVTTLGEGVFGSCIALTQLALPAGLTVLPDDALKGCSDLESLALPNAVVSIGDHAFLNCIGLKSLTLPDSLIRIGENAFNNCYAMHSITLPKNVSQLGREALYGFDSIEVSEDNPYLCVNDGVLFSGDQTVLMQYPQSAAAASYTVPSGVTEIAAGAFRDARNLTQITLPDTLCRIGPSAFSGSAISAVSIPDAVTAIPAEAFCECDMLEEIRLPENLTTIGEAAFKSCQSLKSIEIPYGVGTIPAEAFSACRSLSAVTIPASVDVIQNYGFRGCTALKKIVFGGTQGSWKAMNRIIGSEGLEAAEITCLGEEHSDDLFLCSREPGHNELILYGITEKAGRMSELTIPAAIDNIPIRKINSFVFEQCDSLSSVRIPEGVETLGSYAFSQCGYLKNVTLPNSLKHIEQHAFIMCYRLESIRVPEGITRIEPGTFYHCFSLRDVVLPESLTEIDRDAFTCCEAMASIRIPANVKSIGSFAFAQCESLQSIRLPEGIERLSPYTFSHCIGLKWIYVPENVKVIDENVFEDAASLRDIYYAGSEVQWNGISTDPENYRLRHTDVHYDVGSAVGRFYDVYADDWYCNSVTYAYENGLMNGTGEHIFSPNDSLTRAQLVTILYRMEGSPEVRFRGTFPDVAPGIWYSDAIEWAAANGIVNGYTDGTFGPNAEITREQIATILYRLDGSPEATGTLSFPDAASVGGYAVDAMRWAVSAGLINGVASGGVTNLAPKNTATRAQIAAIIMRYQEAKA